MTHAGVKSEPISKRTRITLNPASSSQLSSLSSQVPRPCSPPSSSFALALKSLSLRETATAPDGNCLYRAASLQIYGDASFHAEVRSSISDHIRAHREPYEPFIPNDEDVEEYCNRKSRLGVHGNNPEIQAMAELYCRPVEVYTPSRGADPINIFQGEDAAHPIRLSYRDGNHYNAIVDPYKPTAGLGLGLPGLHIGQADEEQMAKATKQSEDHETEELIRRKVLAMSDREQTEREVEEAIRISAQETTSKGSLSPPPDSSLPLAVQELIVNGYPTHLALRAYDLVGDNIADLINVMGILQQTD